MSRFPTPTTAYLVDRKGKVHGTHVFAVDKNVQKSVDHLNPCVVVASGGMKYTLAEPGGDDFLAHIEKLFKTEARA